MREFLIEAFRKLGATALTLLAFLPRQHSIPPPPSPITFSIPKTAPTLTFLLDIPYSISHNPLENLPTTRIQTYLFPTLSEQKAAPLPPVATAPVQSPSPAPDFAGEGWQKIEASAKTSTVNLLCTVQNGFTIATITGSGSVIGASGVILTNAHLAEYFLLQDENAPGVSCIVRTGSPAKGSLKAKTLFINKQWLANNEKNVLSLHQTGTGEGDYALLAIVPTPASQPKHFSAFPIANAEEKLFEGEQVITAGYPSALASLSPNDPLLFVSALLPIAHTNSFSSSGPDLLSFGGSVVAEHGSSGGPVVDSQGALVGILVTATAGASIESREARAISLSYIQEDFEDSNGMSLQGYLGGSIQEEEAAFLDSQGKNFEEFFVENISAGIFGN